MCVHWESGDGILRPPSNPLRRALLPADVAVAVWAAAGRGRASSTVPVTRRGFVYSAAFVSRKEFRPGVEETFINGITAGQSAGAVGRGPQTDRATADRRVGSADSLRNGS